MSTISASSSTGQGLFQLLQRAAQSPQVAASSSASSSSGTADASSTAATPEAAGGRRAHGHHHGGGGGFRQKVESAVTSALQNIDPSDKSTDVNQVIKDAITKAIGSGGKPPQGPPPAGGQQGSPPPGGAAASGGSQKSDAFSQLLQAHGVDPQQFRDDVASAFRTARGGNATYSAGAPSSQTGLEVDTHA